MSLVPLAPVSRSLQDLLYPILECDRHLQALYQSLDNLIEAEDYLEHCNAPRALFTLRQTIRCLRRALCDLHLVQRSLIAQFHRELRTHVRFFGYVPPMELEL